MDVLHTPIVCTLNPAELELRRDTLLPGIIARAQDSEVLPEGIRWRFTPSPGLLSVWAVMIDAETLFTRLIGHPWPATKPCRAKRRSVCRRTESVRRTGSTSAS